jgi:hypothetical protein
MDVLGPTVPRLLVADHSPHPVVVHVVMLSATAGVAMPTINASKILRMRPPRFFIDRA